MSKNTRTRPGCRLTRWPERDKAESINQPLWGAGPERPEPWRARRASTPTSPARFGQDRPNKPWADSSLGSAGAGRLLREIADCPPATAKPLPTISRDFRRLLRGLAKPADGKIADREHNHGRVERTGQPKSADKRLLGIR